MQIILHVPNAESPRGLLFHPSILARAYSTGPKFDVNGVEMTRDEIRSLDPAQRTIAHWLVLVDWDLQRLRPYVIIDPYDPSGLLYLNSAEYLVQARTLASSNVPFIVVCRPGTGKPVPTKTPPQGEDRIGVEDAVFCFDPSRTRKADFRCRGRLQRYLAEPAGTRSEMPTGWSKATWREFMDLRKWISKNAPWGEGETVKVNDGNIMGLLMMWGREVLHYLDYKSPGSRLQQLIPLIQHLQTLLRHNGPAFTISRLKISLFCLYSYVGGNPVTSAQLTELGHRIRLRGGLPAFFSKGVRESIRHGSHNQVRLYASILNTYKVMWGPHGKSPLSTIQAPPFKGDTGDFSAFLMDGVDGFFARWETSNELTLPAWEYKSHEGYLIASAGANASCAMQSIYPDSLAWDRSSRNYPLEWFGLWNDKVMSTFQTKVCAEARDWYTAMEEGGSLVLRLMKEYDGKSKRLDPTFLRLLGKIETDEYASRPSQSYLEKILEAMGKDALLKILGPHLRKDGTLADRYRDLEGNLTETFWDSFYRDLQRFVKMGVHPTRFSYSHPITGRLHSIPEPAGKVRVVAICDYFTQVGLKPLHEYIFSLLRKNPNDATFGQQEAVDQFAASGHQEIFSYDLKSATDLIPSILYREVLEPLIGRKGSDLWLSLMTDRTFLAPKDLRKEGTEWVRYTCGQPMGALSSWASLALCHHALVQFAAKRAGLSGWFTGYLVLGDDITIALESVAKAYLEVCAEFGIKVGLAKSLVSKKGLMNFASQTLLGQVNLSPISLGEELVAQSWSRRIELANRINHRYGSGDTDQKATMLTLRRVLTATQWDALQGELTGAVSSLKERFTRFVLQNPFTSVTEIDRLYIERVVEWLGLLCPELTRLSREKFQILKQEMERALWDDLKSTLNGRIKEYNGGIRSAAEIVTASRYGTFETGTVLWRYLSKAIADQFKRIRETDLYPLEDAVKAFETVPNLPAIGDLWVRLSKVPPVSSAFGDGPRENVFSVIKDQAIKEDLIKAPVRVGKLGAVQGRFPAPKAPRETLRAPLQALLLSVARAVGVVLPALNLIEKPVSRAFGNILYGSCRAFENWRIARDASPPWASSPLVPVMVPQPECVSLTVVSEEDDW
jgi:hypothetical protein